MIRRTKLLGSLILLLGAPTITSLSTLNPGSFSLGNLFSSSGGALNSNLVEPHYESNLKNLEIGDTAKKLSLSEQQEIITPKLKEISESIDLLKQEVLNDSESKKVIGDIKSQVDRESKVMELDAEQKKKVLDVHNKYHKDLPNFKIAREYIYKHVSDSETRSKRSIGRKTPDVLDKSKRQAVANLWRAVEELLNDRESFGSKLSAAVEEPYKLPSRVAPIKKDIERAFQRIGWESQVELDIKSKGNKPHTRNNHYGWLDWNKNPYRFFFENEKDFLDFVNNVDNAQTALDKYLQSNRAAGVFAIVLGPRMVNHVYRDKYKYDNAITQAKSDISMKVATKLLMWMNQLKKDRF